MVLQECLATLQERWGLLSSLFEKEEQQLVGSFALAMVVASVMVASVAPSSSLVGLPSPRLVSVVGVELGREVHFWL